MGGPSSDEGSLSSLSTAGGRSRRSGRSSRSRSRGSKRRKRKNEGAPRSLPPAPSDWEQLRAHFQFVLPDDNDDENQNEEKYGATWQERMVQRYHSHLYKEYVLADLSRVFDVGKVGLRWRTETEVANGRGFRCCGNLKCEGDATDGAKNREEYKSAARRHVGIGVPENGGTEPLGMVLPGAREAREALESYLQSCARERRQMEEKEGKEKHSSRKRKRKHRSKDTDRFSLKEQERREQERLARLPHGTTGLHDYEVDFAYVEQGTKKRELVKVRLCLRCAPLLFVSKLNDGTHSREEKRAPAVKAREARERAARSHATLANANDANATNGNAGGISTHGAEDGRSPGKRDRNGDDSDSDCGSSHRHGRRKHRGSRSGRHCTEKKRRRSPSSSSSDDGSSSSGSLAEDSNAPPKEKQKL